MSRTVSSVSISPYPINHQSCILFDIQCQHCGISRWSSSQYVHCWQSLHCACLYAGWYNQKFAFNSCVNFSQLYSALASKETFVLSKIIFHASASTYLVSTSFQWRKYTWSSSGSLSMYLYFIFKAQSSKLRNLLADIRNLIVFDFFNSICCGSITALLLIRHGFICIVSTCFNCVSICIFCCSVRR